MKIVVDRRVFPLFRKSTILILTSLVPILAYLVLFDTVFLREVASPSSVGTTIWAVANPVPYFAATFLMVGAWGALFFIGRNMRRDAVAIFLKKDSRRDMSTYEYRSGTAQVREALRIHTRQSR